MISLLCNTRKCLSSQKITEKLFEFISFVFFIEYATTGTRLSC